MKKSVFLSFALGACLCVITACTSVNQQPIQTFTGTIPPGITQEDMRKAIYESGINRGWTLQDIDENTFRATYAVRSHQVVCDVVLTDGNFSVKYVSSRNMDAENGQIHHNYNRWANNLCHDIQVKIAAKSALSD